MSSLGNLNLTLNNIAKLLPHRFFGEALMLS